ncbi:Uncharacterised protein [Anaerostipes hadrus]|uniref:Uncharacterized protein n=1 Tax=Anaerostipes hadrus TaxID=649756 RepID=A0A174JBT5_ANAHA|nr:hypothetical protein [Anaerostipes hadrus]CUO97113.1 Uncharacterised protein [Anaerostipes hadrus]
MAYGILVDVHGIFRKFDEDDIENMIGNIGRYSICDDQFYFDGERTISFGGDVSYNNNDGYIQISRDCGMIELVQITEEEYDEIRYNYGKRSWADYYKKHKSYSERLNEKAKWKIGDRVKISFVDPRAEKHLFGKDHKPLHFVEGYKGTVIKHAEGYLGRLEYLIEFDDHIGSKTSECGKDGHCFWMDESRDNDKLEARLPMWDHPLLLECKSVKADQ